MQEYNLLVSSDQPEQKLTSLMITINILSLIKVPIMECLINHLEDLNDIEQNNSSEESELKIYQWNCNGENDIEQNNLKTIGNIDNGTDIWGSE